MPVTAKVFPRLHIGLLDLAGATERVYGGAGILLDDPHTLLTAEQADESKIKAPELASDDTADLRNVMNRWEEKYQKSVKIEVKKTPPQHIGLGTKTGLILGLLSAANSCWDVKVPETEIQEQSGRGGVSGIGINAFFRGGFLVDCGQPASEAPPFAPSSFSEPKEIPPVSVRQQVPEEWNITLYHPKGERYHGPDELDFFTKKTPISKTEVHEAISLTYHGIVPAFLTSDLNLLSKSLEKFQQTGFKRYEVQNQPNVVENLIATLQTRPDVAAGMSSMGPLVYAIHSQDSAPEVPSIQEVEIIDTVNGNNDGASITS